MKTVRALLAYLILSAAFSASARADGPEGLYFRLGGLGLVPAPVSSPVMLSNVSGPASLAVHNGPVPNSSVGMSPTALVAGTVGYRFWRELSVETVLALPPTVQLTAQGSLATTSLAATALGNIPTGVPPLGSQLGETKVLPPILTAVWHFLPDYPARPYVGLGATYLISYDAHITNPVLTQVSQPQLNIPGAPGFVIQGGLDVRLWKSLFFTADVKYIAGLNLTATVTGTQVRVPGMPLYGSTRVGDVTTSVSVNPFLFLAGLGWNF